MVPIEIDGDVAAFAIEFIGKLFRDGRAGLSRPGAMLINAAVDAHEYALSVFST